VKFYKSDEGVIVHNNESFFRAFKYTAVFIFAMFILVLIDSGGRSILFALVLLMLIVLLLFIRKAIELDFRKSRYREGFILFGRMRDNWIDVNEFSYISLFPTLGSKGVVMPMAAGRVGKDLQVKELRINLVINNRERIMLQSSLKNESARNAALELAEILDCGFYDCTGPENIWLKEK